ncbi:molybdopterin oxidoreductase family protein [Oharaeibacter diazotrophicus]|uniref:Anaerobic selenocysteine-containing dehydrogenase n=1 Tax=Oharaeibacter diazotrophicus TaxID=1920512 RepID=A0A4R6RKG9_9HYPH|nr:molybdopterin oxidoreductase family protein [Oharaeibacter diazotrophicus]TDP86990.1 anaerobic selenocysteine-containing dehydrogenase [Oharaeibacter diazotrophicus]BBE71067.1 putative dimethyl sulfoxide reductase chain YnfE precursor [Pleomorphomonas sp. SM30]GLS77818.1 dehydrogenase [Oharaeibacter diazotrophicus]
MNRPVVNRHAASACPHDCPSTCALEVEVLDERTIGRIRGAADNDYTAGVICAKVARYAERVHHPDRLTRPLLRTGPKGSGQFTPIGWDEALDRIAEAFLAAEAAHGPQAVWPYYYAGTMGLVQRDGIHRLRHAKGYSRQFDSICTNTAWTGWIAGTGRLTGPDPREIAKADCVVIWGTNAVATQVNVMTHAIRARKTRGAKIVAIDVYETETVRQADLGLVLRPGTDAALACAVMHVAFRDGYADRDYLARYSDVPEELEAHLASRTPEWAAAITGLTVVEIEAFAKLVGTTKRSFFRLGYGFTRSRNGTVSMHAAASIAVVLGSFRHEGGGAFHNNGAIYRLDKSMIEGTDRLDPTIRELDQSRIGSVLTGEPDVLFGGPPVTAMLIQNTNPMTVTPEQDKVRRGFAREDLFVAVHEQFMTDTARMADVVLPATMFLEHDDIYKGGGNQYVLFGPKLIEAPGEARENHFVHAELARRLGAEHPGFAMTAREHVDWLLRHSGIGTLAELEEKRWIDCQPPFERAHFLDGFGHPDGRFHFKPDWTRVPAPNAGPMGPWREMPALPDFWPVIEEADEAHPFRLVTAPARSFLNSSFGETVSGRKREGRPTLMIRPDDAARIGLSEGGRVEVANGRGRVVLTAALFDGLKPGVVVAEGIWANADHEDGRGINSLTGSDPVAPYGGVGFHDNKVRLRALDAAT